MPILKSVIEALKTDLPLILIVICCIILFIALATALVYLLINFMLVSLFGSQHISLAQAGTLAIVLIAMLGVFIKESL